MSALEFVFCYGLIKIIKTMLIASPFMLFALIVCAVNRGRYAYVNIGLLALVPIFCLTSYSRLFLSGRLLYLGCWLNGAVKPVYGACYIGIMSLLAMLQLYRCGRWRRYLQRLQLCEDDRVFRLLHELVSDRSIGRNRWTRKRLDICRVYVTSHISSPVSGGVLRPYIVLPCNVVDTWKDCDLRTILNHELLHISSGHIWLLFFYNIVKLYWWINPLVYLCDWQLRANMEYTCDVGSSITNEMDAHMYGQLMLKMVRMLKSERTPVFRINAMPFAGQQYRGLKSRIIRMGRNTELSDARDAARKERYCRKHRRAVAGMLCVAACVSAFVLCTSYPRHAVDTEICLLDANMKVVAADVCAEGFPVSIEGDCLQIDSECLAAMIDRYDLKGDYAFFSYNIAVKAPGVGGMGQVAVVNIEDGDIWYLARNNLLDKIERFLFRFAI